MTVSKSLRALAIVFFLSGIWDIIAGFFYAFMIGTVYTDPPVHRFYALFIIGDITAIRFKYMFEK